MGLKPICNLTLYRDKLIGLLMSLKPISLLNICLGIYDIFNFHVLSEKVSLSGFRLYSISIQLQPITES